MKFLSSKKIVPSIIVGTVALFTASGPVLVFGQTATQQCAYPLDYTQSFNDANGVITASFIPTPNQGGYSSELHHVQLHVSKNCKAWMASDSTYDGPDLATTEITSSSGQCSFPWFQGPFDKESTKAGDWSAINVKLSLDASDNTPGAGVISNGNYYFTISDSPLNLQSGDILCYDFTYHFKGSNIDDNKAQCNTGICAPSTPTTPPTQPYVPPSIRGDPQFTGFQGQNFQVHGVAGSVYNTFTSSLVQVNSEFVFLTSGHCDKDMNTLCFGHPGSYIGGLGVTIKHSENPQNQTKILIQSGRYNSGLHVHVNDRELESNNAASLQLYDASVRKMSKSRVVIQTPTLSLHIVNSDRFLNLDMDLNDSFLTTKAINSCEWPQKAPFSEPHGLMGQTWCLRKMQSEQVEGEIDDYFVQDGLFGKNFQYNKF